LTKSDIVDIIPRVSMYYASLGISPAGAAIKEEIMKKTGGKVKSEIT